MAKDKARYDHALSRFQRAHRDETQVPPYMHSFDVVYGPIANEPKSANYKPKSANYNC